MHVTLRSFNKLSDANFIYATWLRGLYYGSPFWGECDKDAFFANYSLSLEELLSRPDTEVLVAALPEDPDIILGYAVLTGTVLHWVHVKTPFRGLGIARKLLEGREIKSCSHLTQLGNRVRKVKGIVFNPFNLGATYNG